MSVGAAAAGTGLPGAIVIGVAYVLPAVVMLCASLAQQRMGSDLSGRLIGLPLTTGPFLIVVCIAGGADRGALAARGVIAGLLSVVVFCWAYSKFGAHLVGRRASHVADDCDFGDTDRSRSDAALALLVAVTAACVVGLVATRFASLPILVSACITLLAVAAALYGLRGAGLGGLDHELGNGALVVRIVALETLLVLLTAAEPHLGSAVAGALSAAPVLLIVLIPSTHVAQGVSAVIRQLRSTLCYLPGSVLFATVVALSLKKAGFEVAFLAAIVALVAVNGVAAAVA